MALKKKQGKKAPKVHVTRTPEELAETLGLPVEESVETWKLYRRLRDPRRAAKYLNEQLASSIPDFLLGVKQVAQARCGMARLAQVTELNREHLYKALSEKGDPRLSTIFPVLKALGLRMTITWKRQG